jgi:hypothetical protein
MKYKAIERYMAPVSINTYSSLVAKAFAKVLLPQEENPSIAIIIFFDIAIY